MGQGGGNQASAPGPRKGAAQRPRNSPRKSGGGGSRKQGGGGQKQGGGGRKQGGGGGRQSGGGGEALPALEKNCRLASMSALDSMRASLAPVWQDVQSVALSDPSQDSNRSMHHNLPLLQPSTQKHPNQPLL